MVNTISAISTKQITTSHNLNTKNHDIRRWKSRPWFGTGTEMWRG